MHMIERKQDALNGAMLRALMAEHLREEREKVQHQPIQDASFSALASRIVEDARNGKTHKSAARTCLQTSVLKHQSKSLNNHQCDMLDNVHAKYHSELVK